MITENKIMVELSEDEATLFREFQKGYYWLKPLGDELGKYDIKSGYLTLHYTKYGEVVSFDLIEKFASYSMKLPI